jgi:integrase/recombinase XerD
MKPRRIAPKNEQLTEALQGELATYEQQGLYQSSVTKRSAYRYRGILVLYQRALGGAPPSLEVSKVFLGHLRKQGYAPASLRLYRAVLKNFHKWRGETLDFPIKMPHHNPPYIDAGVVAAMLEFAKRDPRDYLILRLLSDAGLRREEAENLRVQNVVAGNLHVRGKGDKDRVVPMTDELAMCLKAYCATKKPDDLVLGVSGSAIYRAVKKYARMAGKPEMKPHDLRHAFATRLLENNVNIRVVQELLGHANLNTTQIYTAVTGQHLKDAIKNLHAKPATTLSRDELVKALQHLESSLTANGGSAGSPGGGPVPSPPVPDVKGKPTRPRQAVAKVLAKPPDFDPQTMPVIDRPVGFPFTLALAKPDVFIESLEARTDDLEVPYRLLLFERELDAGTDDWGREDFVQMAKPVSQRTFLYQPASPRHYVNAEGKPSLHGAIVVHQRPFLVDLMGPNMREEQKAYLTKPVQFTLTLRYQT